MFQQVHLGLSSIILLRPQSWSSESGGEGRYVGSVPAEPGREALRGSTL